jgi:DNA processing protein
VAAATSKALCGVIDAQAADTLSRGPQRALVDATFDWLGGPDRSLLTLADADYPSALLESGDAPCVLYVQGRRDLLNTPAFAIVGSRNATPQGLRDAQAFARTLSDAGLCIVSGLALGIDAAAHRGALAGECSTIAVMGTGPDRVYPAANRPLAHEIARHGCLVTEFPVTTAPSPWNFPRRNRLISGLSRGVLVVEAALESGSLITARFAGAQGRDVFAVPGSIHSSLSKGCHALIRDGATLVQKAEDILSAYGMGNAANAETAKAAPQGLLQQMGFAPMSIDQMTERTGIAAADLCVELSRLEMEGYVQAIAGGWFQRVEQAQ